MHAVIISFRSSLPPSSLMETMSATAPALLEVDGFVSKVWLRDGDTFGGSYLFDSEASATAYVESPFVGGLRDNDAFTDLDVRTFDVIDDLTAITAKQLANT